MENLHDSTLHRSDDSGKIEVDPTLVAAVAQALLDATEEDPVNVPVADVSSASDIVMDMPDMPDDGKRPFCTKMGHMMMTTTMDGGSSHHHHGGGGMIMYMEGFKFSMAGNQPCLNLLMPTWTLDSSAKFLGACVGVFFMAIVVEGVSKFRHTLARQERRNRRNSKLSSGLKITVLHGSQALMGYVLMLVTMTFSIELLLSVVLGLAVGYGIFFQSEYYRRSDEEGAETRSTIDEVSEHVTTNPCCEFMADEIKDLPTSESIAGTTDEESGHI